jgi:hypothetical protein
LTFKAGGAVLGGSSEISYGKSNFIGEVKGDGVSWDTEANSPVEKTQFSFTGKLKGNDFTGEMKAGNFGTYPFKSK